MKTIYDIQQYIKNFGTIIYTGDRSSDLELMRSEVQELFRAGLMEAQDFQSAIILLRHEINMLTIKEK